MSKDASKAAHGVAIVVDQAFGERLIALASRLHVWIIDTPANKAAALAHSRESSGAPSLESGATTFTCATAIPPDESVASMLETVDVHHGEYSHSPPWSFLEVFGASPTPRLSTAPAEYGFTNV